MTSAQVTTDGGCPAAGLLQPTARDHRVVVDQVSDLLHQP